ncbi:MAG TPA: hypothetical protein VEG35_03555, partial [Burkholderiales bacterium]|nr:hypothetical protein [Burkholderiales bacterium]
MNATTRFLARFCREHRLDEKTFVVPSFSVGHQIGQALAGAGEAWVNLRFVTLGALAQETAAAELLRQGRRLIPETGLLVLADSLFRELQEASSLEYFGRLRARPGLARALVRAIRALRLSGLGSGAIDAERFCLGPKGRDIIRLLSRYEAALDALRAFDIGGLYAAARDAATGETAVPGCGNGVWFLCLEDLALSRVEGEFLRAVAGDRLVVVPRDPAFGLERPRGRFVGAPYTDGPPAKAPAPTSDAERLSWLFAPADAPPPAGDGSVGLFRAVGQANECREVVRRVLAEGWPFDRVEVIAPPGSVYPALFHLLAARCALPVTLADGMPLLFTTPGRVLSGLADWVEGRFQVSGLCHLIESGDLALRLRDGETEVPGERAARLLWNAMIGWGRDRYLERLDAHRTRLEADLRRPPRGEDEERSSGAVEETRRAAREVGRLREVVRDLLACVPDFGPGDAVEFGALASGLAEALTRYVRVRSGVGDQDGEALSLVIAELGRIADEERALAGVDGRGPRPLRLDEALERLRAAVSSLTVGASSPLPGHLHVSSFGSGGFSGRPVTFVVGLNDTAVPGEGLQDPVLLDAERQALSESLPTSADALKANLHSLATMLASLRGRVVLSCSSYDIMDERRLHPSSVLLQALRLVRGEPGLDYSDLDRDFRDGAAETGRSDPAGFVPDGPGKTLDERDWWFLRLAGGRSRDRLETVKACFPTLADGIAAAEARAGTALTAYEGLVKIDGRRFDPLLNHDLTLSASRLELLAKCPYAYFLRYVLEVEPPRDL